MAFLCGAVLGCIIVLLRDELQYWFPVILYLVWPGTVLTLAAMNEWTGDISE